MLPKNKTQCRELGISMSNVEKQLAPKRMAKVLLIVSIVAGLAVVGGIFAIVFSIMAG